MIAHHQFGSIRRPCSMVLLLACASALCGGCSVFQPHTTNVLKTVNPETDAVSGSWFFEKNALTSEAAPHARIALSSRPHGDYELNMTFSRVIGDGSVNVILPVAGRQVMLVLADTPDRGLVTGLEFINGKGTVNNATADPEFGLVNHKRYKLKATVRMRASDARILVDVDNQPVVRWAGPLSALSLPQEWALPNDETPGVGAHDAVVQVYSATLRMIPAEASTSR